MPWTPGLRATQAVLQLPGASDPGRLIRCKVPGEQRTALKFHEVPSKAAPACLVLADSCCGGCPTLSAPALIGTFRATWRGTERPKTLPPNCMSRLVEVWGVRSPGRMIKRNFPTSIYSKSGFEELHTHWLQRVKNSSHQYLLVLPGRKAIPYPGASGSLLQCLLNPPRWFMVTMTFSPNHQLPKWTGIF